MSAAAPPAVTAVPGHAWRDAAVTALIAAVLLFPLVGLRTLESPGGLTLQPQLGDVAYAAFWVFIGRALHGLLREKPWFTAVLSCLIVVQTTAALPSFVMTFLFVAYGLFVSVKGLRQITLSQKWRPHGLWVVLGFLINAFPWAMAKTQNELLAHAVVISFSALFLIAVKQIAFPIGLSLKIPAQLSAKGADWTLLVFLALLAALPLLPFTDRYMLDVLMMVLTYAALAYGLNIVVGYAGLLDLGYVAFYAIGAYACALLGKFLGFSFWLALPCAGMLAVLVASIIGGPVLRLRGDYLAIVTLGFAEITRIMLINAVDLTGGPNGLSGVPRPTLLGLDFAAAGKGDAPTFHEFFGLTFSPVQRLVFLYYLLLMLATGIGWLGWALRRLPIGRAWEAVREDEIAAAAMGINRARVRLCAYILGALCAGLCGAFFAARQGFISPESFTFNETATVLAIVVLGGIGHPLGIALAALFIIGLPELFRDLEQFRMLAFGAGMVLIMIWRPGGLMATRQPAVTIKC